jgi:hypothetical protein
MLRAHVTKPTRSIRGMRYLRPQFARHLLQYAYSSVASEKSSALPVCCFHEPQPMSSYTFTFTSALRVADALVAGRPPLPLRKVGAFPQAVVRLR